MEVEALPLFPLVYYQFENIYRFSMKDNIGQKKWKIWEILSLVSGKHKNTIKTDIITSYVKIISEVVTLLKETLQKPTYNTFKKKLKELKRSGLEKMKDDYKKNRQLSFILNYPKIKVIREIILDDKHDIQTKMKHPETLYFFEFVKKNEPRPQQQVEEWFADLITPGISLYKYLIMGDQMEVDSSDHMEVDEPDFEPLSERHEMIGKLNKLIKMLGGFEGCIQSIKLFDDCGFALDGISEFVDFIPRDGRLDRFFKRYASLKKIKGPFLDLPISDMIKHLQYCINDESDFDGLVEIKTSIFLKLINGKLFLDPTLPPTLSNIGTDLFLKEIPINSEPVSNRMISFFNHEFQDKTQLQLLKTRLSQISVNNCHTTGKDGVKKSFGVDFDSEKTLTFIVLNKDYDAKHINSQDIWNKGSISQLFNDQTFLRGIGGFFQITKNNKGYLLHTLCSESKKGVKSSGILRTIKQSLSLHYKHYTSFFKDNCIYLGLLLENQHFDLLCNYYTGMGFYQNYSVSYVDYTNTSINRVIPAVLLTWFPDEEISISDVNSARIYAFHCKLIYDKIMISKMRLNMTDSVILETLTSKDADREYGYSFECIKKNDYKYDIKLFRDVNGTMITSPNSDGKCTIQVHFQEKNLFDWHTHPKICEKIYNVYGITPSTPDIKAIYWKNDYLFKDKEKGSHKMLVSWVFTYDGIVRYGITPEFLTFRLGDNLDYMNDFLMGIVETATRAYLKYINDEQTREIVDENGKFYILSEFENFLSIESCFFSLFNKLIKNSRDKKRIKELYKHFIETDPSGMNYSSSLLKTIFDELIGMLGHKNKLKSHLYTSLMSIDYMSILKFLLQSPHDKRIGLQDKDKVRGILNHITRHNINFTPFSTKFYTYDQFSRSFDPKYAIDIFNVTIQK
jgi:hypothetical protein